MLLETVTAQTALHRPKLCCAAKTVQPCCQQGKKPWTAHAAQFAGVWWRPEPECRITSLIYDIWLCAEI